MNEMYDLMRKRLISIMFSPLMFATNNNNRPPQFTQKSNSIIFKLTLMNRRTFHNLTILIKFFSSLFSLFYPDHSAWNERTAIIVVINILRE
jgi:hypothetical protein